MTDFQNQCWIWIHAESQKPIQVGYLIGLYFAKVSILVSPNMSAPTSALPPVTVQTAAISIDLNSTMFQTFLMGLCSPTSHLHQHNLTVFRHLYHSLLWHSVPLWQVCLQLWIAPFFNDLTVIVTRKGSQARVVTATITMLYLLSIAQLPIQWQVLQWGFVDNGETRETIFMASANTPPWVELASNGCIGATNILADGLLVSTTFTFPFRFSHLKLGKIWRCFHMWNRSLVAISLPFFFLVTETGEIWFERTRSPN